MTPDETSRQLRRFGVTLGGVLSLLALAAFVRGRTPLAFALGVAAALFLLLGALAPPALSPVHAGWMALARGLAWFNSRLILLVVFLVIVTPIGLVLRLIRKDPLERGTRPGTYWRDPEPESLGDRHFEREF